MLSIAGVNPANAFDLSDPMDERAGGGRTALCVLAAMPPRDREYRDDFGRDPCLHFLKFISDARDQHRRTANGSILELCLSLDGRVGAGTILAAQAGRSATSCSRWLPTKGS